MAIISVFGYPGMRSAVYLALIECGKCSLSFRLCHSGNDKGPTSGTVFCSRNFYMSCSCPNKTANPECNQDDFHSKRY